MLGKPDWKRRAIPIIIHGDGGQYTKSNNNSLMVTSWKPLLNESFDSGIFLLFTRPKNINASIGHINSHQALWKSIVHLFNAMFVGVLPHADHNGRRWAQGSLEAHMAERENLFGPYFFAVWSLTGDLPYLCEEYKLPHFNSNAFCWFCGANRSDATYTDTSGTSRWRSLQLQYHPGLPPASDHPIWELCGVHRWHLAGDLMHTGCLGVLLWRLGAVLWELVFDGPFRGTIEARRLELGAHRREVHGSRCARKPSAPRPRSRALSPHRLFCRVALQGRLVPPPSSCHDSFLCTCLRCERPRSAPTRCVDAHQRHLRDCGISWLDILCR